MATFLLIHGSCHGAWCWRDVLPALKDQGHSAQAIDLPSHGEDKTPLLDVTLDVYAQAILASAEPDTILVGHSMAGFPITLAADLMPERFAKLIYLCAYVPVPGQSLIDMRKAAPSQPLLDAIVTSDDKKSFTIDPNKAREKFYNDCSDESVAFAVPRLCPQAIAPQATPITAGRSCDVEAHYIVCEKDQTIPPAYQKTMSTTFPKDRVHALPTSHSPFFSTPKALAELFIRIAENQ